MTQNQVLKLPLATSGSPRCFVAPTVRFTSFEAIDQYQQVRLEVLAHFVAGWLLAYEGLSSKDRCTELKATGRGCEESQAVFHSVPIRKGRFQNGR